MKLVNTGNIFRTYDDSLKTFDKLPTNTYLLNFNKMAGFYLEVTTDMNITEKIYGPHRGKVDKILRSFNLSTRNLGVILSGAKGIGKSICAKLAAEECLKQGYPVIIINTYYPGVAEYLTTIDQEVCIIFDEFDKTFEENNDGDPQVEMLTLFDGLSQGKKLFIITCNEIRKLNDYLINRPGRFHYHFRFNSPTTEEIREYMLDNVKEEYQDQINAIIDFSSKVTLNYDCLRAIAYELNLGYSFADSLNDLNIVNVDKVRYDLTLVYGDGSKDKQNEIFLDLFDSREHAFWFNYKNKSLRIEFDPTEAIPETYNTSYIDGKFISYSWDEDEKNIPEDFKIERLILKKKEDKNIHYLV